MREHAGTTTVDGEAVAEAEAREAAAPEGERAQDGRTEAEPDGAANGRGEEDADGPETRRADGGRASSAPCWRSP
ncbi:hypothetical protein ID875_30450 [Streptomyces globisporus]|uniref:Uncharacterized protein n=1 Tax=Streptomyces globisporus TaxID=1908 RepID=A0A927GPN9_STRGL|nr:hypothetical protein [Streptomyces globisporus]